MGGIAVLSVPHHSCGMSLPLYPQAKRRVCRMERLQAFKFGRQPDGEQAQHMRRFVFNKVLALQQALHAQGEKKLSYAGVSKTLTEWKAQPETLWLKETHLQPLQQMLKDLEHAYVHFFEQRADFPRFKKKG